MRAELVSPWSVNETVLMLDCLRCCRTKLPGCSVLLDVVVVVPVALVVTATTGTNAFDWKLCLRGNGENTG